MIVIVQMFNLGVESLPLVAVIALFLGSETVIQAVYQMAGIVPMRYLGVLVCKSLNDRTMPGHHEHGGCRSKLLPALPPR